MFDTKADQDGAALRSFWVQQILVPLGSLIIGGALLVAITDLLRSLPPFIRACGQIFVIVGPLFSIFLTGYRIQRTWPSTYRTGRFVWILPTFFLSLFVFVLGRHVVRVKSSVRQTVVRL